MFSAPSQSRLGAAGPGGNRRSATPRAAGGSSRAGTPGGPSNSRSVPFGLAAAAQAGAGAGAGAGAAAAPRRAPGATAAASRRAPRSTFDPSGAALGHGSTGAGHRSRAISRSGSVPAFERGGTPGAGGADVRAYHALQQAAGANGEGALDALVVVPGTTLVRDDFHAVTAYSKVPGEVRGELARHDLYSRACTGYLDIALGFAYLATSERVFVWNFLANNGPSGSSSAAAPPTCYALAAPILPEAESGADVPYLYSFVPWASGGARAGEPGLLAVHKARGELFFAQSISAGAGYTIGGGSSSSSGETRITLAYNESVTALHRLTTTILILATSTGRLFRVRIATPSGQIKLQISAFSAPRGFLGRLFGGGGSSTEKGGGGASSPSKSKGGSSADAYSGSPINDSIVALCSRPLASPSSSTSSGAAGDADLGRYELMAVGKKSVQKWHVLESAGAGEKCVASQDIRQVLASRIAASESRSGSGSGSDADGARRGLEVFDAAYAEDGSLALLYGHHALGSSSSSSSSRKLGIVSLAEGRRGAGASSAADGGPFAPIANNSLGDIEIEQDARPNSTPKLALPFGGPVAYVVLPNLIAVTLLDGGSSLSDAFALQADRPRATFQETIYLKEGRHGNRFLAFGAESVDVEPDSTISPLPILTAHNGALLVEVDGGRAQEAAALLRSGDANLQQDYETARLKSKLEAAVFFGDVLGNVLDFRLPAAGASLDRESLVAAVQQLSQQIASSTSPYLPGILDMREQLADRLQRQLRLITIIGADGLTEILPKAVRDVLCADAQLVAAGKQIWDENSQHANAKGMAQTEVMVGSIESVMEQNGYGASDNDLVRAFFRHHLDLLPQLFSLLASSLKSGTYREAPIAAKTAQLLQSNRLLVPAYHAATVYNDEAGGAYEVDRSFSGPLAADVWTCKAASLELLETAFHATDALIRQRSKDLGSAVDMPVREFMSEGTAEQAQQRELKTHLAELARATLAVYQQRLSYLRAQPEESYAHEAQVLLGRYKNIRPQVIHPLQRIGNSDQAFTLAQEHRDFRTLAELCTDEKTGSEQSLTHHYLDRYGQDFAFALYTHYIDQKWYRKLLQQDQKYVGFVSAYMTLHPECERVAWLHEVGLGDFKNASGTLAEVALSEQLLGSKQLELSLAKLCYIAELSEAQTALQSEQLEIEQIDDQIDLVEAQAKLRADVIGKLDKQSSTIVASGNEAEVYVQLFATRLADLGGMRDLLLQNVQRCLEGKVLQPEELVDTFTLPDNDGEEDRTNLQTAFRIFVRSKQNLPDARRRSLIQSYWRRVITHSDWDAIAQTSGKTDEEIKETLRDTALYEVLTQVEPEDLDSETLVATEDLLEPPTREVLLGRFSQNASTPQRASKAAPAVAVPDHLIDLLLDDYEAEVDVLKQVLQGGGGKWIEEARRVAMEDLAAAEENADADGDAEISG